jgi:hypothetical protein
MGTDYELKNRYMHLDYNKVDMIHSDGMVYMNQGYDIAYECLDEYEGAHLYKKQ